jgi:predicted nuclease with RNAse H fold
VLELKAKVIIGIDLAGKPENATGWAYWEHKRVETHLLYMDNQIVEAITQYNPETIAVDAPFRLPKIGILRKADREMIKNGYRVFPPTLPAMRTLTMRAMKLNKLIAKKGFKTIEVHPTSTRKALNMPLKDWGNIQTALMQIGLEGDLKVRTLTPHEIEAAIAALTAYLCMRNQTEALGDEKEGYIIVPKNKIGEHFKYD